MATTYEYAFSTFSTASLEVIMKADSLPESGMVCLTGVLNAGSHAKYMCTRFFQIDLLVKLTSCRLLATIGSFLGTFCEIELVWEML